MTLVGREECGGTVGPNHENSEVCYEIRTMEPSTPPASVSVKSQAITASANRRIVQAAPVGGATGLILGAVCLLTSLTGTGFVLAFLVSAPVAIGVATVVSASIPVLTRDAVTHMTLEED